MGLARTHFCIYRRRLHANLRTCSLSEHTQPQQELAYLVAGMPTAEGHAADNLPQNGQMAFLVAGGPMAEESFSWGLVPRESHPRAAERL